MRFQRRVLFAAVALGLCAAGVASAQGSGAPTTELESVASEEVTRNDLQTPLPASSGHEKAVFEGAISALSTSPVVIQAGLASVTVRSNSDGEICTDVSLPTAQGGSCYAAEDVATGVAYMAMGDPTHTVYVIGLVPDDAAEVVIDGATVKVSSNVWFYSTTSSDPFTFTVRSADGTKSVTLGE